MTLHVHTARISYGGQDRLDVTRKSADAWALAFAPSWTILRPAIAGRRRALGMRETDPELATDVEVNVWRTYVPAFVEEMQRSYRTRRADWDRLLAMPRAVLVCYCTEHERCHRTILARDILPKLGAIYEGETGAVQ